MLTSYITVIGNVVSHPRLEIHGGVSRCTFRLAVGERRKDKATGNWEDAGTTWYSVTAWRDLADHVAATLEKGHRAVVVGRFRGREWSTDDGRKGTALEIEADAVGPELRWQTATVKRAQRTSEETSSSGGSGSGEGTAADEWATPGFDPQTGEITAEEQAPPVAVGAGSGLG